MTWISATTSKLRLGTGAIIAMTQYAPAYRYGYTVANDQRYSGRDWDVVEADVRSDWERERCGTWDEFTDSAAPNARWNALLRSCKAVKKAITRLTLSRANPDKRQKLDELAAEHQRVVQASAKTRLFCVIFASRRMLTWWSLSLPPGRSRLTSGSGFRCWRLANLFSFPWLCMGEQKRL